MINHSENPYELNVEEYDSWYDVHSDLYELELESIRQLLPMHGTGIEIGVGTGRFASRLGINIGVEPSVKMSAKAKYSGIKIINAECENLPLADSDYDFVLMVTVISFLKNVNISFEECRRILKPSGTIIIAFIDRESWLGKKYESRKKSNPFYKNAHFYSSLEVENMLLKHGFTKLRFKQTYYENVDIAAQTINHGYGLGGFVVVRAEKE